MNCTQPKHQGFSLVEVLIALLMVSTILVSVLGMLSIGTRMVGEAGEASTQGRIAQGLVGELQLSQWDKLDEYNLASEKYRYYDYQGQEVDSIDNGLQVYTALIRIENAGMTLPGTGGTPNPDLRMAHVFISNKAGAKGKQEVDLKASDYESNRDVTVHSRILVKMSKATQP